MKCFNPKPEQPSLPLMIQPIRQADSNFRCPDLSVVHENDVSANTAQYLGGSGLRKQAKDIFTTGKDTSKRSISTEVSTIPAGKPSDYDVIE
jgi:hypothetical protein